jgi:hypothetical protein
LATLYWQCIYPAANPYASRIASEAPLPERNRAAVVPLMRLTHPFLSCGEWQNRNTSQQIM